MSLRSPAFIAILVVTIHANTAGAADAGSATAAAAADLFAGAEPLRTTGPAQIEHEDTLSSKKLGDETNAKRDEQIATIKKLLEKAKGKPQEADLVFRLAELYWAKSKVAFQSEFRAFDDAEQRFVDGGRNGKEPQLAAFTKQSEAFKRQAMENNQRALA